MPVVRAQCCRVRTRKGTGLKVKTFGCGRRKQRPGRTQRPMRHSSGTPRRSQKQGASAREGPVRHTWAMAATAAADLPAAAGAAVVPAAGPASVQGPSTAARTAATLPPAVAAATDVVAAGEGGVELLLPASTAAASPEVGTTAAKGQHVREGEPLLRHERRQRWRWRAGTSAAAPPRGAPPAFAPGAWPSAATG